MSCCLNKSLIKILNRTKTKPRRPPHIYQSNSSIEKLFHMLTCYLGPGTAQCTLKCLLLRVLQFNRASPFLCQDNIMSQISLTGINGSESKAPWRPLHLKHCSILHYILGLHICNNYILSLFTPSSALRAVHGLGILHHNMEDFSLILDFRCLLFSGLAVQWQFCLPSTEYCC